jgi:hypothetical protein
MAGLERRVFYNCAGVSFLPASPDADQLRSREPVTFIRFIGPVRFSLPALPPTGPLAEELQHRPSAHARIPCRRTRPYGYILAGVRWARVGQ